MIKWVDIKGFEGYYQISNKGDIKALRYYGRAWEKIIPIGILKCGYHGVNLSCSNGRYTKLLHRLIAEAFIANPENKEHVNHKNGNKLDNNVCNLEWVTRSENMRHALSVGLLNSPKGELSSQAKLNNSQVLEIRQKANQQGVSKCDMAKEYSVSLTTIRNIVSRKKWAHI